MRAFELLHPTTVTQATKLLAEQSDARPLAGGQDLLGTMKDYILTPSRVVDLKRIDGLGQISVDNRGARLGALVTLTKIDEHPEIRAKYPALAEAARSVGTIQIRNVGTLGGNLCQRPRCWYFRDEHIHCLKKGGAKCYAADDSAENKYHAIFGAGPCHIVHPSDLAPALVCLGATVSIAGPGGASREVALEKFFTLPENFDITRENILTSGEVVTSVFVPASPAAGRSTYLKLREKDSMDFALTSVAMAISTQGAAVRQARVVLGGVAPAPWRAHKAEEALVGKPLTAASLDAAAQAATEGAAPLSQNRYKIALVRAVVRRAGDRLIGGSRPAFFGEEEGDAWTQ